MKTPKISFEKLGYLLYEIGSLRKIPRSHRQNLLTNDVSDNLSSHIFRVTWIGWFLATECSADPYKTIMMCMLHDLPEARSGDQNWINKKYVKVYEDEIIKDQLQNTNPKQEKELTKLYKEYELRESLEAKLAKDADLIDQMLLLKEHAHNGNKEASNWLHLEELETKNNHFKLLHHEVSKQLAREIAKQQPSDWWQNFYTHNRK